MNTQIIEQVEFFSEAELESLEFVPEELEAIEAERVPNLDTICFEDIAKDLEAYFEGGIEASKQGEHIFNALGDLASEFVKVLTNRINKGGAIRNRISAVEAIRQLRGHAAELIRKRNHKDFRTGQHGDKANAQRYSQFAQNTRKAIENLLSKNPSLHTKGYTDLNRLLDNLGHYTIDEKAKTSARNALPLRQKEFDTWFKQTRSLMHATFKTLIRAALAVNRTQLG